MKNRILILAIGLFSFSTLFTVSCQKEDVKAVETSLETKLANDQRFENTILAATALGTSLDITSLSSEENIQELTAIAERINSKTATAADYQRVKDISGVTFEEMINKLGNFNLALAELNKAYPELASMKQDDLSSLFTATIKSDSKLSNLIANPAQHSEFMKVAACPLQDICKLAVTLTNLFAGNAICAAIGISIPVIGDLVCKLVLTLGVGILNGICGALPC